MFRLSKNHVPTQNSAILVQVKQNLCEILIKQLPIDIDIPRVIEWRKMFKKNNNSQNKSFPWMDLLFIQTQVISVLTALAIFPENYRYQISNT